MTKAINLLGKRKPEDGLETKPILKKPKEKNDSLQQIKGRVELSETKSDQANLKKPAVSKKTLFINHLSPQTEISDIIDFFKDVGEVVRVRLQIKRKSKRVGCGFVAFASADEAKKALEKKNGEYLLDRQIFLANKGATYTPSKYCIDHKVWYEDYTQRESLSIEEDETPPDFVEKVLFVANLSPLTTKIAHIIDFFKDVAQVVSVRFIVNHKNKHVGCGFLEFASANQAKWALEYKNGEFLHDHKILLMKGFDEKPDSDKVVAVREKTLFVNNLSWQTEISDIINFFKYVGKVVHVRLAVDHRGKLVGYGFVEFSSANAVKQTLEEKNGEYLHDCEIILDVAKIEQHPPRPQYCIDHKIWYEDYLQRESLRIEEDAAVEGLDETPDFVEEVAVREKTVFIANQALKKTLFVTYQICNIKMFKKVGKIVGVRLIVDHRGEHVGCGFIEFASADEAKKVAIGMNGYSIFLGRAEIAPYPFRLKYNLYKLAEKLWYEDNLRRVSLDLKIRPTLKIKQQQAIFCGKKITFSDDNAT